MSHRGIRELPSHVGIREKEKKRKKIIDNRVSVTSPSLQASRPRLDTLASRMRLVEVVDCLISVLQEVGHRFPTVVLIRIALPLDQIHHAPAITTSDNPGVNDGLYFISFLPINHLRRGFWRIGLIAEGRRNVGREERFVEYVVRLPSLGNVKTVCGCTNLLENLERSIASLVECGGWSFGLEVGNLEPNLITNFVVVSVLAMPIIDLLHCLLSLAKRGCNLFVNLLEMLGVRCGCWYVIRCAWVESTIWMAALGGVERCLVMCGMDCVIVRELRRFEVFHPVCLVIVHVKAKECFELLVVALRESVGLRVVCR